MPFCQEEPPNKDKYLLRDGDIVISRAGSVGFSHLVRNPPQAVFASYLIRFRPLIDEKYVAYFLKSPDYWQSISEKRLGIAIPNVNATKLKEIIFPLAPLTEQHRIVTKLEELLPSLDAGVANLKRIQAALKRYRAAVLKAACEGRLVPQDPNDEPADTLLERISAERWAKWEADWRAKGKDPKKAKYEELKGPNTEGLPELPAGWCWANLGQFANTKPHSIKRGPFGSTLKKQSFVADGYKVYEQKHAIRNDFSIGEYYIDARKFKELQEFAVAPGDLIISCSGTIGRVAIVPPGAHSGIINQALLKISLDNQLIETNYFVNMFQAKLNEILVENTGGSAMQNMSSVQVLKVKPYPLPPLAEQRHIVAEVERRLSVASHLEKIVEGSLVRAERLRQSILRRAFEGKLVGQEAEDEPACVLLERISAEGVAAPVLFRGQEGVGQGMTRAKTSSSGKRR